jgi:hypothetical protein
MTKKVALVLLALGLLMTACGPSGNLRLVNHSGTTICFVQMSPTTQSNWGADWLGSSETISDGSSRSFQLPTGVRYDIRLSACPDGEYEIARYTGVTFSDEVTTITAE